MHVTMYLRRAKKKKEMKVRGKCASGQQRVGAEPKESTRGLVCLLEWSVEGLQLLQAGVNDRVEPAEKSTRNRERRGYGAVQRIVSL